MLVPALEAASGLEAGHDFGVGYSPERIAPGPADDYSLRQTSKLVSAGDEQTLSETVSLYESIIEASVHPVPTIETAEAAKCLENVQRDVNIALINEFTIGSRKLDIDLDPRAVLDAAGTKPAFHDYQPGIVGGHCIPIDPHLLAKRFNRDGFYSALIESARRTNDSFPRHIAEQVAKNVPQTETVLQADGGGVERLSDGTMADRESEGFRTLVLGFAYKANISDPRNDALGTLIDELNSYGASVDGYDPLVDDNHLAAEFGVHPVDDPDFAAYDAVIVTTLHDEFRDYSLNDHNTADESPYIVDLTGHFRQSADTLSTENNVS
ncbi:nucleotide sugar dehydrogenase [Natronoarchaeum sp. GCM10025703]|uniref:nucleotide sugar dehydrogenase n=1 Tax=Natronoarchaeum sp. GCM10025703 TaxID=3252685 RepID=UPI00361CDA12